MKSPRMRTRAWLIAPLATVLAALVLAPASLADTVTGGKTVLKFDQATGEGFADMSIGIQSTGAAKDGKHGFNFPIKGGDVNKGPKGEIDHKGGLAFFTEGGPGVEVHEVRGQDRQEQDQALREVRRRRGALPRPRSVHGDDQRRAPART